MKFRGEYPEDWPAISARVKEDAGHCCIRCHSHSSVREGRVLTVHHLDNNKSNVVWWNLAALCQRCHLQIQGRVDMRQHWPFEHSAWFKPYAAGWYAHKYLGRNLSRVEVMGRLDELLALERLA